MHKNYKQNTLQYKASDQYGCGNINQINDRNWLVINDPNQDYLVRCHDGSVSLGGEGLLWVKTNVTNTFANGLIDIQNSDLTCNYNFFEASGALSDKVQLISFRGTGTHTFSGTTFKDCGINPYRYIRETGRLPDNWDPSLIYISGDSLNSFYGVTFKHDKNSKIQPWDLRPTRPIRLEESALNVTFSHFYNSSCFTQGSFLHLGSLRTIFISNCDFQECYCEGGLSQSREAKGHAIYITNQNMCEVTIDSCDFLDCGRNYQGHAICCEAPALILSNNNFNFENINCSGCVRCIGKGKYHFINNYFNNTRNDDRWKGVCIHYDGNLGSFQDNNEDIIIERNRFNYIRGQNEGRCISAQIRDGSFTTSSKNIIENCPLGGFCVKIMQRTAIEKFELSDWEFRNNEVNSKFGGGSGIWIENEGYNNVYTYNFTLYVKGCKFENNVCYERGGGFQMGYADDIDKDKIVTRIEIEMYDCSFTNNTASHGGGAIAISTNYPLTITGCHFISNKSPENGGAIYIRTNVPDPSGNNQQMPYATIAVCDFIGNSGKEAHCIYVLDGPQTPIEITNCNFYNNYDEYNQRGACILSNCIELAVTDCNFENDDIENSSGGVNITSRSILTISDTKFIHCKAGNIESSYGGGISYFSNIYTDLTRIERIQITDCIFEENTALMNSSSEYSGGGAIFIRETVESIIIEYCKFNNCSAYEGGAILFQSIGYILINICTFNSNKAGLQSTHISSNIGGAICVWSTWNNENNDQDLNNITIVDSEFFKNQAFDANAVFIDSSNTTYLFIINCQFIDNINSTDNNDINGFTIVSNTKELYFSESRIEFADINEASGGIKATSIMKISDSTFINNCNNKSNSGESIYAEKGSEKVEIINSNFTNCGKGGDNYYVINLKASNVIVERNIINFTSSQVACHAIFISKYSEVNFVENRVYRTNSNGSFYYYPDESSSASSVENIRIEKCIFEDCQGRSSKVINCFLSTQNITFYNNTIQNCSPYKSDSTGTGYIFAFSFQISVYEFVIDNIIFRNLTTDSEYGGGSGVLVQCKTKFNLVFHKCIFENNYALYNKDMEKTSNGKGGAIQYGWSSAISNVELKIEQCEFIENKADRDGGALCLMIQGNIEITDCQFIDNSAGLNKTGQYKGGSIAIYPNYLANDHNFSEKIDINNCTFQGNTALNGNSIFIDNATQTEIIIHDNCQFKSNYKENEINQSSIIIEAYKLIIEKCNFEFTSVTILSNGIEQGSQIFNINECQFSGIFSEEAMTFSQETGDIDLFSITNCSFIDCFGNNSSCFSVIFKTSPKFIFENNIIQYTKNDQISNYLFSIYFNDETEAIFINNTFSKICGQNSNGIIISGTKKITFLECKFNNNTSSQLNADGGGIQFAHPERMSNIELEIRNTTFYGNKADRHGGAVSFKSMKAVIISYCIFENNLANDQYSSSLLLGDLFSSETEGFGGALFIHPADNESKSFINKFSIENCTFINNSAVDGYSIYIEGEDLGTEFIIHKNTFIDNHLNEESNQTTIRGVITSEIFNLYEGKIEEENEFIITNQNAVKKLLYINYNENVYTDHFTQSFVFSDLQTTIKSEPSQLITQLKSFSITYVLKRSVSFSFSYFKSNTFIMSFNSIDSTYEFIIVQSDYYSYFPYIIHFYSPSYVPTFFPIAINNKRGITKEQLIGIVCGSVSVFFFILGIIILSIKKKNQEKNQSDDYYDLSYSSNPTDLNEIEHENNEKPIDNQNNMLDTSDESSNLSFWL